MLPQFLRPLFLGVSVLTAPLLVGQTPDRITFQGKELFLNGLNLAWDSFANDIGPNTQTPRLEHFESVFQEMNAAGGNSMRLWLHTTGANTPAWDGSMVTGPGVDTIEDLRDILDLAASYDCGVILCLWSFDMLRTSNGTTVTDRAMAILTQETNRQSYIDNSLVPMVEALKGHPAIICWEIFNEPEGMSNEHGWEFNRHVPMSSIQAFINQTAGAIHRTDPDAQVSNGSWAFIASTDVGAGNFNYYRDDRLIAAGGDPDGVLDFYMVHYYDWAGTSRSPFHYPASHWGLDKPLVVAEFYPDCQNCGTTSHATLYENGYAGALGWSWTDVSPASLIAQIADVAAKYPEDILLDAGTRPVVAIVSPAVGTWYSPSAPITLVAEASVSEGTISHVAFYLDDAKLGEDAEAPFTLDAGPQPVGLHVVYAVAEDNNGKRRLSEPLLIKVGRPEVGGKLEAEDAWLTDVSIRNEADASQGSAVEMRGSGSILWTLNDVPAAGTYEVRIGYNLNYDSPKTNNLVVNGTSTGVTFSGATGVWAEQSLYVDLMQGLNTLQITPSWGWMMFDYIAIPALAGSTPATIDLAVSLEPTTTVITVQGPPDFVYELLYSTDMQAWTVGQTTQPLITPFEFRDPIQDPQHPRFYRIQASTPSE